MGCGSSKSTADKTAAERREAWEKIRAIVPRSRSAEDKARRIELFKQFDTNNSGKLTMAETYTGCIDILHLNDFTSHARDIVKRAFNKAKDMGNKAEGTGSEDFVEFLEFRLMLCYIYDYLELTVMFDEIDTSGNGIIDPKEFKEALPKIEQWGLKIENADAAFKEIDGNGSGQITFDEFAAWASAKKLDVDGDPDNAH